MPAISVGGIGNAGRGGSSPETGLSIPPASLTNSGIASAGTVISGLLITQSHFYVDPSAKPAGTWTWLAVVKNERSDLACDLSVEGNFSLGSGPPIKIFGAVAAPPYRRPAVPTVYRCIAPGEVGVSVGAAAPIPSVNPSSVVDVSYAITGTLGAAYVPGDWVTVSNVQLVAQEGGKIVRGTFTNGAAQMPWWEADVFPKNARGMPLTQFIVVDPRSQLAPGATWDFQTPVYDGAFNDVYVFIRHSRAQ